MVSGMDLGDLIHLLRAIVIAVEGRLPATDTQNAWDLLDAGEPGIALENLCTQLYEFDVEVSESLLTQITTAGVAMGLASDLWTDLTVET